MTVKMTERDKKLLIYLLIILLLFLFGWLILRPLVTGTLAKQEALKQEEQLMLENDRKAAQVQKLTAEVSEKEEKLDELTPFFYPQMTGQEIDRVFTGQAIDCGLTVSRLYINMLSEPKQVTPYRYSRQRTEEQMDSGALYIREADVNMEMTGNRDRLQKLLDIFVREYPAVKIFNVQWTDHRESAADAEQAEDLKTLTLDMQLYMYEGQE